MGIFDNLAVGLAATPSGAQSAVNAFQAGRRQVAEDMAQRKRQQALDQASADQRAFENFLQLSKAGAVPTEVERQTYTGGISTAGSGAFGIPIVTDVEPVKNSFKVREDNPAARGSGMRVRDPQGRGWYLPTDQEQAASKLDDANSVMLSEQLAAAANKAGFDSVKPGQRIPFGHVGTITEGIKRLAEKAALDDDNSVTITDDLSKRLSPHGISVKPGARISVEHLANLRDLVSIAEPQPKSQKNLHFQTHTDDSGNVTTYGYDPESGQLVSTEKHAGVGGRRRDPDAELTLGQKKTAERFTAEALRYAAQRKADKLSGAEKAFTDAVKSVTGTRAERKEKLAAARDQLWQSKQQIQNEYEDALGEAGADVQHIDYSVQRQGMQPAGPKQQAAQPIAGGRSAPPPNGMVSVQISGHAPGQIPRSQLSRFLRENPGAKVFGAN